jgi:hypothetical protein
MADDFSAYGWGQGLSDMLGGYLSESDKIRQENEKKNQEQLGIEQVALQHLMTSDDPRVKAAAITSWLSPRKSGPGPLAKWYGQQEANPAFQQVQTILGQGTPGMAPWMTPQQKTESEYGSAITGRSEGIFNEYEKRTGVPPPQGFVERTLAGMSGAPQRAMALQSGVIGRKGPNGQTVYENGFFDPSSGEYYDQSYTPVYDGVDFRRTGIHDVGSTGSKWYQLPDGTYQHVDAQGRLMGITSMPGVLPPGPAPAIIQPGPGGEPARAVTGGRGGQPFTVTDLPGTGRQQETLRETYQRLNSLKLDIERQAQKEDANILGLDRASYETAVDHYAQKAGLGSYSALIQRMNEIDKQLTAPQNKPQSTLRPPPGPVTPPQEPAPKAAPKKEDMKLGAPGNVDLNAIRARVKALQEGPRPSQP